MRRVLMIAFQFPPFAGSSAIQRTLRFVQHLPRFGWQPVVLSAQPHAFDQVAPDLMIEVPDTVVVERAFALDAARHLALCGRYPAAAARPDRWWTWRFDAVRRGRHLLRRERPAALWSTYPIPTAHAIGLRLQRASGLPWIADFRDPMAQPGYPADATTWRAYSRIERATVQAASRSVFTTPGAVALYRARYAALSAERFALIENGYDEEAFTAATLRAAPAPTSTRRLRLLHSGVIYPYERDPTALFDAIARLATLADVPPFEVVFRASAQDTMLRALAESRRITPWIRLEPSLPYGAALSEMLSADALLVLQASNCNQQIPAKLYEYLRAGRPIVGLTDPIGDTAGVLRRAGVEEIARLDSADEIFSLLCRLLPALARGEGPRPSAEVVRGEARVARAQQLAMHLTEVAGPP